MDDAARMPWERTDGAGTARGGTPLVSPWAAIALLSGAVACLRMPQLPDLPWLVVALAAGAGLALRRDRGRLAGILLCGFALTGLHARHGLDVRLPAALEQRDFVLSGTVLDLPRHESRRTRFDLRVDGDAAQPPALRGRRLQLSWFDPGYGRHAPAPHGPRWTVAPGSRWRLHLRLRAPHGLRNVGTIDSERRALAGRVAATGYVREPEAARMLAPAQGLDAWRSRMSGRIAAAVPGGSARFVRALAVGDTRGLEDGDWARLRATGLTHLIAISGFHVGLVAGFFALLAVGLWRLWPRLGRLLPRPQGAALGALVGAMGYAAIAGLGLPTVRTVLMIAVVVVARLLRRAQRASDALALAMIAVLLVDPLAILSAGFWLSFAGVAWLVWCLPDASGRNWRARLGDFFGAQLVATVGLLPLTVVLFGQASLAGPLANLLAIPWWSLVVVPLAVLGTALDALHPGLGHACWRLAGSAFDPTWVLFGRLADSPLALWWLPQGAWFALPLALLGGFWLLLPRGIPGKPLALLLWLPLLWPARHLPEPGAVTLEVIDVGQGLSVLVRTSRHALLYDMGPAQPEGFDAGEQVVVPALHALGVRSLDAAVVSHGDNDHAGGFPALARAFPPGAAWTPEGAPPLPGGLACQAGLHWQWDGVQFTFLHPPRYFPYLGNAASCVLRIQSRHGAVLLTGDIPAVVERELARRWPRALRADVVLVAHHGSDGSSDPAFVAATGARWALVSAGQGNRFHHPAPAALSRWQARGASSMTTFHSGAQQVALDAHGVTVRGERDRHRRLWDASRGAR